MIDPSEITTARNALDRLLAKYREAGGLKQHQLAPHTHYCRSTIASIETGRQRVPRAFWERCEQALDAGGALLAVADQLEDLIQRQREETNQLADIQRERQPEVRQAVMLAAQYAESAAFEDLGTDDVSGMLYRRPGAAVIVVNEHHSHRRQRFTIAHEIGHAELHDADT
jgi:hypothetical protein